MMDRYSAANTVKVQGNAYVGKGTVLYSDSETGLDRLSIASNVNFFMQVLSRPTGARAWQPVSQHRAAMSSFGPSVRYWSFFPTARRSITPATPTTRLRSA